MQPLHAAWQPVASVYMYGALYTVTRQQLLKKTESMLTNYVDSILLLLQNQIKAANACIKKGIITKVTIQFYGSLLSAAQ